MKGLAVIRLVWDRWNRRKVATTFPCISPGGNSGAGANRGIGKKAIQHYTSALKQDTHPMWQDYLRSCL